MYIYIYYCPLFAFNWEKVPVLGRLYSYIICIYSNRLQLVGQLLHYTIPIALVCFIYKVIKYILRVVYKRPLWFVVDSLVLSAVKISRFQNMSGKPALISSQHPCIIYGICLFYKYSSDLLEIVLVDAIHSHAACTNEFKHFQITL